MTTDAAREVVDAILAVTPIDPEGLVITGFQAIQALDGGQLPTFGDPRPVAARQAAAAARTFADLATATARGHSPYVGSILEDFARDLRELADQLDTQETP